jgi:hypothetical protein
VELAGLGLLPLAAEGRVEPAQVRERGGVRQAVQDLLFFFFNLFFGGLWYYLPH